MTKIDAPIHIKVIGDVILKPLSDGDEHSTSKKMVMEGIVRLIPDTPIDTYQIHSDGNSITSEDTLGKRDIKGETPPSSKTIRNAVPKGFDEWYDVYPRKIGRKDAERAFANLMRMGVSLATLMDATREYIRSNSGTESQYIKYPATFLRNERWRDYAPTTQAHDQLGAQEKANILSQYEKGEYSEDLVRKIEVKYGVRILP